MRRRTFVARFGAAVAGAAAAPDRFGAWLRRSMTPAASTATGAPEAAFDPYFHAQVVGFLRAARATAPGYAVCDFPGGTRVPSCLTPSGRTYVSVARMLPLLATWVAAGRDPLVDLDGERLDLRDVLAQVYTNAFDPRHPDYWGEPPANRATQRSVEAALVAEALARLGDEFLGRLSGGQRVNIQSWLASCTTVPERATNHAWFTCLNQSVREALSGRWPEFRADPTWIEADLEALDRLYPSGGDGWSSDSPDIPIYDDYNFWTFANFPLLWDRVARTRHPAWSERFRARVGAFLRTAPHFFAADGSHPWFGRSLLYRWALLSPLVLGYQAGLWPHSPGLLRRIVRLNLEWFWGVGAFDQRLGKLRETLSAEGTPAVREAYIDNGSPYWSNLGLYFYGIPGSDPFWTAPEEPLPVERADFVLHFDGPRMLLAGTRDSGQVRWLQARGTPKFPRYRDRYIKFAASSHFPCNILERGDRCPWDQALVFRSAATGVTAGRSGVIDGALIGDGVRTRWWVELDGQRIDVETTIRVLGEFERRTHEVRPSPGALGLGLEALEGSHALGLRNDEQAEEASGAGHRLLRSRHSGHAVASWIAAGFRSISAETSFDEGATTRVNLVYPRIAVVTLHAPVAGDLVLDGVHYASPRPLPPEEALRRGQALIRDWPEAEAAPGARGTTKAPPPVGTAVPTPDPLGAVDGAPPVGTAVSPRGAS